MKRIAISSIFGIWAAGGAAAAGLSENLVAATDGGNGGAQTSWLEVDQFDDSDVAEWSGVGETSSRGRASVSIESVAVIDESERRGISDRETRGKDQLAGHWKASAVKEGVDVPDDLTLYISREKSDDPSKVNYSIATKVVNSLRLRLNCERVVTIEMDGDYYACKPGVVMSTLMVGNEKEDKVKAFLESINNLKYTHPDDDKEVLTLNRDEVNMSRFAVPWVPVVETPSP